MRLADSAGSVITMALMRLGPVLFVGNGRSRSLRDNRLHLLRDAFRRREGQRSALAHRVELNFAMQEDPARGRGGNRWDSRHMRATVVGHSWVFLFCVASAVWACVVGGWVVG